MKIHKVKISPEVITNELVTQTYSGVSFGYYSGLTNVLTAGTVSLGTWNIGSPESPGNLISFGFEPIEGETPIIWINKSGATGYDWSFYLKNIRTGSTVSFITEDGNRVNYTITQTTQEAPSFLYLFLELIGDGITIPVGSQIDLIITQPDTSQLIDLSIPVLLEQSYEDVGYYSVWDGEISQLNEEVNFTFVFSDNNPNEITIYNTSDNKKTYLKQATYKIDWGDGTPIQDVTVFIPESISHTYATLPDVKSYTITFYGSTSLGEYVITKTVNVPYFTSQIVDSQFGEFIGSTNRALSPNSSYNNFEDAGDCGFRTTDPESRAMVSLLVESLASEFAINNPNYDPESIPTIVIPVVFHIVYSDESQNISDARILGQLQTLNEDFSATNPQISSVPEIFKPVIGNMNIQFCLATQDPNGRPTTGIIRRPTSVSVFQCRTSDIFRFSSGGSDIWPRDKYLNIYIGNINGCLGYAAYPGFASSTDAAVIDYKTVGANFMGTNSNVIGSGRIATHEVGHWLGLIHIWGEEGDPCSGDNVDDTPLASAPNYGCPPFPSYSDCPGNPIMMTMNYMDYANSSCKSMFSKGQVVRVHAMFQPGAPRYALLSSNGCEPPTLPPTPTVTIDFGLTPTVTPTIGATPTIAVTPTIGATPTPPTTPTSLNTNPINTRYTEIQNPYGEVKFISNNGSWETSPKSQFFINYFDTLNTVESQASYNYVSVPIIISGYTTSRLQELKVYGTSPYVNDLSINLKDGTTGKVISQSPEYTAYTINSQNYLDFPDGKSVFVVQSYGLTEEMLVASAITKMEYLMNVIEQPEIQSNVFIERGKNSGMENFRRIGEVGNTGSLDNYGYKFFDVRNYNDI